MMMFEERLKSIRRRSSSDAPGDPERFRRVALTNTEMMSQGPQFGTPWLATPTCLSPSAATWPSARSGVW